MEFLKEDATRYVVLKISPEETKLLRDLLRIEAVVNCASVIGDNELTPDKKVRMTFACYDTFRNLDDQLTNIEFALQEGKVPEFKGFGADDGVVISKLTCKIYLKLCTETILKPLPPNVKKKVDRNSSRLLNRIEESLSKDFSPEELGIDRLQAAEDQKNEEEAGDSLPEVMSKYGINILKIGQA